jgi:thiol:disulfide interchange protein DsbD
MKRILFAAALFAAAFFPAFGHNPAQAQEQILSVKVIPASEPFKPGQTHGLTLEITIRPPYHINSDQPTEDYLIGATVDFKPREGVRYGKIKFPPGEMRKFSLAENPLSVYEGQIKVTAEVSLAADFKGKTLLIEGTVGYQACDDMSCLPPADVEFASEVKVEGGGEAAPVEDKKPAAEAKSEAAVAIDVPPPDGTGGTTAVPTPSDPAKKETQASAPATPSPFEGKGLPLIFVLVFIGGLALNLTPCIYPIIPITISYFGGQSEGKKGGVVLHAILYVVGMAITYSALGSVAAFTGGLFGAALQNPVVLIFIALVMILLSLSMFDVYELRMPAFLNKLAGGQQKGYFGTVFMGLTVGIIAAPCIGPFVLGLLTYVGNRGSVLLGFSLFFVLALGLGVPFLILGIFSGSLQKLPRSGAWMVWVRKIFGFILIAMALYFVRTLIPNPLYYHLGLALTMLVGGIYMAWIEPTKTAGKAFRYVRTIIGLIFLALALVVTVQGIQSYLDEAVAEKLQGLAGTGGIAADQIAWQLYSEERVAAAFAEGKPVFIDSMAEWCIPCKELDKFTFSEPEVVAASRAFVMLKADLTNNKDEAVKTFYKKYGVRGVPTLIFLKPDGAEIAELRTTGFEKKAVFLPKMLRALELSRISK